jgi:H/ACA ribonucleoprotein complex subunit 1
MSEGIVATSYKAGDKFFIDPAKLLPLERFLPQPKGAPGRGGAGGRGEHCLACSVWPAGSS